MLTFAPGWGLSDSWTISRATLPQSQSNSTGIPEFTIDGITGFIIERPSYPKTWSVEWPNISMPQWPGDLNRGLRPATAATASRGSLLRD